MQEGNVSKKRSIEIEIARITKLLAFLKQSWQAKQITRQFYEQEGTLLRADLKKAQKRLKQIEAKE